MTPRDDDEDAAPPLRSGSPLPTPVQPPPPPGPEVVAWGVCGVYNQAGDLAEYPGERGVIRYVTGGVRYARPPCGREWRQSVAVPERFEMRWDADPAVARTLAALRAEVEAAARAERFGVPGNPLLGELDAAAVGLAELAARLHQLGWSVGLLRPDNVVLSGREVVPLDLGFTWQGTLGSPPWDDAPGRPPWLDPEAPYFWLYDHPPVRQQFVSPGNGVYQPTPAGEDVQTIARLVAWLISGHEQRELPVVRNAAPIWGVLHDAASGKLGRAEELAGRLREAPPSGHFARPEPTEPAPRSRPRRFRRAGLGLCLLAVCASALWFATRGRERDKTGGGEDIPPPLAPALPEPQAGSGWPEVFNSLAATKGDATSPDEQAKRNALRARALDAWIADYQRADAVAAQPGRRLEAATRFLELKVGLEALLRSSPAGNPEQRNKENQCLEFVSARVRELSDSPP